APRHVHQGAAGVTGIDGGIGLDEHLGVRFRHLGTAEGGDDAAGHGLANAEGIADRQYQIADFGAVGVLKFEEGEATLAALDLEHGQVRLLVLKHDLGVEFTPVRQGNLDFGRAADLDHVRVGDDDAVRMHDDAGTERVLDPLLRQPEALTQQPPEQRILGEGGDEGLDPRPYVDVDHRRGGLLYDRSKGVLRRLARRRRLAALRLGWARRDQRQRDQAQEDTPMGARRTAHSAALLHDFWRVPDFWRALCRQYRARPTAFEARRGRAHRVPARAGY